MTDEHTACEGQRLGLALTPDLCPLRAGCRRYGMHAHRMQNGGAQGNWLVPEWVKPFREPATCSNLLEIVDVAALDAWKERRVQAAIAHRPKPMTVDERAAALGVEIWAGHDRLGWPLLGNLIDVLCRQIAQLELRVEQLEGGNDG